MTPHLQMDSKIGLVFHLISLVRELEGRFLLQLTLIRHLYWIVLGESRKLIRKDSTICLVYPDWMFELGQQFHVLFLFLIVSFGLETTGQRLCWQSKPQWAKHSRSKRKQIDRKTWIITVLIFSVYFVHDWSDTSFLVSNLEKGYYKSSKC